MGAAFLDLASIEFQLDGVGRFGGGKNDPANDQSFGYERDGEFLGGVLLRVLGGGLIG